MPTRASPPPRLPRRGRPHRPRPIAPRIPARGVRPRRSPPLALSDPRTLSVVGHELRTPITTIFAAARLLQSTKLAPETRRELVDDLVEEAERLRDFVEDLIALVGAAAPPDAPADPVLIQRLLPAVLAAEAERQPGLRFRAHVPRDLPPLVVDDLAVVRLLRTLVATSADLATTPTTVEVTARPSGARLGIRVITRRGRIDEDLLRNLFEPGVATEHLSARGRTQFGLAAAGVTARRLGGRVWARRAHGGIELGLELPLDGVVSGRAGDDD